MRQLIFCSIACCLLLACTVNNTNNDNSDSRGHKLAKSNDTLRYKEVVLQNSFADTCFVFKDEAGDTINFNRNFEILENTFGDTMNVGINFVAPRQKGKYFTIQSDTLTDRALDNSEEYQQYLEEGDLPALYTKWLCLYNLSIRRWGKTTRTGQMRIRVYYKAKKIAAGTGY